jgi:hypothetical protein
VGVTHSLLILMRMVPAAVGKSMNRARDPWRPFWPMIQTSNVNAVFGLADDFREQLTVDDEISVNQLKITWNAAVNLDKPFIRLLPHEISYMVVGIVAD